RHAEAQRVRHDVRRGRRPRRRRRRDHRRAGSPPRCRKRGTPMKTGLSLAVAMLAAFVNAATAQVEPQQRDAENAADAARFEAFLGEIRTTATARGISAPTLDAVLPTIRLHRRAVQADRSQAEFVETYGTYLSRRVTPQRIESGRALMAEHGEMIRRVA